MDANAISTLLTKAEFLIWLTALAAAAIAKVYRHFPAVLCFLGIKTIMAGAYSYLAVYHPEGSPGSARAYVLFFDFYWVAYFLATIAVFFSIEQIIRRVLSPLSGLSRLGVLIFRFTGGLTLFIALTAHLSEVGSVSPGVWLPALFISFGMCMCVFEVTLMLLLTATAQRLGLSFRTRIFGLSAGFCFLGIMDLASLISGAGGHAAWADMGIASEAVNFGTLLLWSTYFLLPDQPRGALMLTGSSTLMRWNEIVSQLGPDAQPAPDGATSFMADVEGLVEQIMLRNQGRHL